MQAQDECHHLENLDHETCLVNSCREFVLCHELWPPTNQFRSTETSIVSEDSMVGGCFSWCFTRTWRRSKIRQLSARQPRFGRVESNLCRPALTCGQQADGSRQLAVRRVRTRGTDGSSNPTGVGEISVEVVVNRGGRWTHNLCIQPLSISPSMRINWLSPRCDMLCSTPRSHLRHWSAEAMSADHTFVKLCTLTWSLCLPEILELVLCVNLPERPRPSSADAWIDMQV